MIEFESVQFSSLKNSNLKLSLILNHKFNFIYHEDQLLLKEMFNLFNGKNFINAGSLIIDKIIVNQLDIKQRNTFFYNYFAYGFDLNQFDQNLIVNQLINQIKNIYTKHLNHHLINELLLKTNLLDKVNSKLSDLNEIQKVSLSIILGLIKKPKVLLLNFNDEIIITYYSYINQLINNLDTLDLDVNIIWFTTNKIFANKPYYYDLTDKQYYLINQTISIYTNQEFHVFQQKKNSTNFKIFNFITHNLLFEIKYRGLLVLLVTTFLLFISFSSSTNHMEVKNYLIIYISSILGFCLYSTFFIHHIFFNKHSFLSNLNILGFNNILILLSCILLITFISFIPVIIAVLITLIVAYSTNEIDTNSLFKLVYPLIIFIGSVVIVAFICSHKLHINYYLNNK